MESGRKIKKKGESECRTLAGEQLFKAPTSFEISLANSWLQRASLKLVSCQIELRNPVPCIFFRKALV